MPVIRRYQSQVSVPSVPRAQRLSASDFGVGADLSAFSEAAQVVGGVLQEQEEREAVSFASRISAAGAEHWSRRLPEAEGKAVEGAAGFSKMIDDEFGTWQSNALKEAPSPHARKLAEKRLQRLRINTFQSAIDIEVRAGRAKRLVDFDQGMNALGVAAFNNPEGSAKYLAQANGNIAGAAATWMPPQIASEWRSRAEAIVTEGAIRGLIASDPDAALRALESGKFDAGLSATKKAGFERDARAFARNKEREARIETERAEAEARKLAQDDFLGRIIDLTASPPTQSEILDSALDPTGPGSKHTYLKMLDDRLNGRQQNVTDPRVYRERVEAIAGGKIADPTALHVDIGNGLSINDFERLKRQIDQSGNEAGRVDLKLKERAIKLGKSLISTTSLMGGVDPVGEQRLYAFEFELDEKLRAGEAKGISFQSMLNPQSEDYVLGPLIDKYRRTLAEQLRDQVQAIGGEREPAGKAEKDQVQKRLPGETIAQWLQRTRQWTATPYKEPNGQP